MKNLFSSAAPPVFVLSMGLLLSACLNEPEKEPLNAEVMTSPEGVSMAGDFAPVEVGMKWTYACSSYFGESRNTPSISSRTATVYDLEILSLSDSGMVALFHEDVRHAEQSYWQANDSIWRLDTAFERGSQIFLGYHAERVGEWWSPFADASYQPVNGVSEVLYDGRRHMQWESPAGLEKKVYLSNIGLKSAAYYTGGNGWSQVEECRLLAHSP